MPDEAGAVPGAIHRGLAGDAAGKARWVAWIAALVLVTGALRPFRGHVEQAHVTLLYLMLVLGASASGGRGIGLTIATLAIGAIDFFFQAPYDTMMVHKGVDWLVLGTFYVTALVATGLVARARRESAEAHRRTEEARSLAEVAAHSAALAEASRMKEMVLVAVSHDLRTPLTTIKALAQSATLAGSATGRAIEEQVDRLARLVRDVLELSRLQGTDLVADISFNTAEDLVGAVVRQTQGILDGRRLEVRLDMTSPTLAGRFDYLHTLRILGNLIENAVRFTPSGGTVSLGVEGQGDWLVFTVADRGPGVPAGEREAIFEPFYRPPSASPDAGHAGLGLAIARRLAAAQHGTLTYTSRHGGGSVFTLRLPRSTIDASEEDLSAVPPPTPSAAVRDHT